jgi:hypothetical protein
MARFQYSDGGEHVVNVDANGNLTHRFDVAGSWKSEVLASGCQPGGGVEFDINYRGQLHLWAPRPESTMQHCWYDTVWHAEVLT